VYFGFAIGRPPNGLRYWRWDGRGLCLGAEKTRSQKNARKCRRIPSVQCTLCWLAFVQGMLIENQNRCHKTDKIIARDLTWRHYVSITKEEKILAL